jgi:hypothetical protein
VAVKDLPAHEFTPNADDDPLNPGTICWATLRTGERLEDGYGFITQCGHTRAEHGLPSPKTEGEQ